VLTPTRRAALPLLERVTVVFEALQVLVFIEKL
jgi:hypothetical protein